MDALVKTAIESLVKKILPLLEQQLSGVLQENLERPSNELAYLIGESRELLDLMSKWTESGKTTKTKPTAKPVAEDDEAAALMAEMDDDEAPKAKTPAKPAAAPAKPNTDDDEAAAMLAEMEGGEVVDEMDDDEAAAMLAEMEEAPKAKAPAKSAGKPGKPAKPNTDDDEAAAMLAAMEGGEAVDEMDDDEAAAMLAEMEEAPKAKTPAKPAKKAMDDDEAAALLAEMEGAPESEGASSDDELSDAEADALLAEMEAPSKKPARKVTGASPSKSMGDDEASRLLAEMEGEPAAAPAPKAAPAKAAPAAAAHDHHEADAEDLKEIPEWEPNDFQSDPSMLNDFITNSDELMQTVDDAILRLEQDPTNKGIIEEIFRAAHTLKGGSGMFGFKGIERVMHRMENLFDLIRKDKLVPTSDTIDVVFQGIDMLRRLLQAVKDGGPCGVETGPVVRALSLAAKGKAAPKTATLSNPAPVAATPAAAAAAPSSPPPAAAAAPKAAAPAAPPAAPPGGASGHDDDKKDHKNAKKTEQSTIRVDLERLDVLVNLVGELVIDRTRFASIEEDLRTNFPQIKLGSSFSETVQLFGRHMNEIQDIIMKVRMVPITRTLPS